MAIKLAEQQQVINKLKTEVAQESNFSKSAPESQAVIVLENKKSQISHLSRLFGRCSALSLSKEGLTYENIG